MNQLCEQLTPYLPELTGRSPRHPNEDAELEMRMPVDIADGTIQAASCANGIYGFAWFEYADQPEKTAHYIATECMEGYYVLGDIFPEDCKGGCYLPETGKPPAVRHILSPEDNMTPNTLFGDGLYRKQVCAATLLALHGILKNRHGLGILTEKEAQALRNQHGT